MKLQYNILKNIIKENIWWIIIFIILSSLNILLLITKPIFISITPNDFLPLIGYSTGNKDSISILLFLYQIILYIQITHNYYTYEANTPNNILLRIPNQNNWLINKISIIYIFTIITKLLQILIIYLFFINYFPLKINYFLIPILYLLTITNIIITINNFTKHSKPFIYILITLIIYITLPFLKPIIILIINIILLAYNILKFNLKRLYTK